MQVCFYFFKSQPLSSVAPLSSLRLFTIVFLNESSRRRKRLARPTRAQCRNSEKRRACSAQSLLLAIPTASGREKLLVREEIKVEYGFVLLLPLALVTRRFISAAPSATVYRHSLGSFARAPCQAPHSCFFCSFQRPVFRLSLFPIVAGTLLDFTSSRYSHSTTGTFKRRLFAAARLSQLSAPTTSFIQWTWRLVLLHFLFNTLVSFLFCSFRCQGFVSLLSVFLTNAALSFVTFFNCD